MPRFSEAQITPAEVDAIARYVELTQEPEDAGGFGIGHIGPVPEGLVAWLTALVALLLVARLIGERGDDDGTGPEGRRRDEGAPRRRPRLDLALPGRRNRAAHLAPADGAARARAARLNPGRG